MGALVSVIIPAYNAEKFIAECVESILSQEHNDLEVIIVNDGSKDKTRDICDALAKKDARVKVIHQENAGVSAARSHGMQAASGDYICFADADDTLPENCIEALLSAICSQDADAVFGNYRYIYENGKTVERLPRIAPGTYNVSDLKLIDDGTLSGITFGSVWGAIYKSEIIRANDLKFRSHLKINEDGVFNIEYCLRAEKICYISDIIYNYRQWKSKSNPNIEMLCERLEDSTAAIKEICPECGKNDALERQIKARELFCIFQASVSASGMKYSKASKHYKSIWQAPVIAESDSILDLERLGKAKKVLWGLIKRKKYKSFYLAVHYAYPILGRVLKR